MDLVDQTKLKLDVEFTKQDVTALKSEIEILRKELDLMFDAYIRCDARILSYQIMIPFLFRQNPEQREAFEVDLEGDYQRIYQAMKEKMKETDPRAYARVYGHPKNL